MKSISAQQLIDQVQDGTLRDRLDAVYVYSPLCGTCALGETMLTIALEALPQCRVYRMNINDAAKAAILLQITSVPCLIIWDRQDTSAPAQYIYAMQSVTYLYEQLSRGRG
ncbi:thioredoxin family protein [Paenibacillus sp. ACRRX]|uniref:thioredoxin family protein n=1 Tax=Paenibacillus sp. ACRRX TaxID=2918206 RepID=UPI001EF66843|nr:thioredoxin family protein [Paenibacillus sp. ACRRX]MCG7407165.1 thioredoxin family protein [Paenibacillus sp. ACRRX]